MTIQDNPLTYLNDDSLYGLDRSLWELELINTQLTYVPSRAIRTLQKLRILNLSGKHLMILTASVDIFNSSVCIITLFQVIKYQS